MNRFDAFSKLQRDEYGLLPTINYSFKDDDGSIDWQKLIDPQDFVPNSKYFEKRKLPVPETAEGLPDNQKFVLLRGFKRLSVIRGFTSLRYIPIGYSPEEVVISCEITWIGNIETNMEPVLYSSIGNASLKNTPSEEFSKFLGPLAENKGFVKCVRSFLQIPVYGQDEFCLEDKGKKEEFGLTSNLSPTSPQFVLIKRMQEKGISFEQLKKQLCNKHFTVEQIAPWQSEADISASHAIKIIKLLT